VKKGLLKRGSPSPKGFPSGVIYMLEMNNIEVVYSNVILVLRGVSLKLADGRIVCLLGANGSGKTTSLKAISGLLHTELGEVTHGNIMFDGKRIDKLSPEEIAGLGITQVLEGRRLFPHLTTQENLLLGGHLIHDKKKLKRNLSLIFGYFPILEKRKAQTCGYLSGGEQQMLVIGRGLMTEPKVMLLDEPSLGLAPNFVEGIYKIVQRINTQEKVAMLLVEQNASSAIEIADYGYVMENGRVVLDGPTEALKENEDIKEFYLGFSQLGQRRSYREVKHYRRRKRWL
jgi:branched-chain amino acid transport system ATP-binding protein